MPTVTLRHPVIEVLLSDLADAIKKAVATKASSHIIGYICSSVANIIAASGSYGGSSQKQLMEMANGLGFHCEFWGGQTIRVSWAGV